MLQFWKCYSSGDFPPQGAEIKKKKKKLSDSIRIHLFTTDVQAFLIWIADNDD